MPPLAPSPSLTLPFSHSPPHHGLINGHNYGTYLPPMPQLFWTAS